MPITDAVKNQTITVAAAAAIQAPMGNRVFRDNVVSDTVWRWIELPAQWAGELFDVMADVEIWWMMVDTGATSPSETTSAVTPAALVATIPARLPKDTPAPFILHKERLFLAFKGAAAGLDIRVVRR